MEMFDHGAGGLAFGHWESSAELREEIWVAIATRLLLR